jgi:hypothetical protein
MPLIFNEPVRISEYITSNVKTTVNKEFERMYNEEVVAYCKVLLAICMVELIESTEDFVLVAERML